MAWDASPSAGFSTAAPEALWLPLHAGHETLNVAAQRADPNALLNLYRRLLALRRATPALHAGTFQALDGLPETVFGFERAEGESRAVVFLNLGDAAAEVAVPAGVWHVDVSTHTGVALPTLRPTEGVVLVREG